MYVYIISPELGGILVYISLISGDTCCYYCAMYTRVAEFGEYARVHMSGEYLHSTCLCVCVRGGGGGEGTSHIKKGL